ncbi:MBL fold metallo-hydrolase [Nocardiopsis sp. CNT312]|uniref:MBL fold metallo-hydrolase n=1 Tax=Nocardiopsis sp. CNT312 TaxID=1137268 RepID=UPI0004AF0D43|nr:MBL fold metallo-hydrolase [Nocardiopsis sp. CNT312]
MSGARIEHLATSGLFTLDGGSREVDNNVWVVGGGTEAVVIDAAHDADAILAAVGGTELRVLHMPGHSPGAVCSYAPGLGAVFSGDTLFQGGSGATGRSFPDFPTIIASIRDRLLTLPPETVVHTGHGPSTVIGGEAPHLQEWSGRGHEERGTGGTVPGRPSCE